MIKRQTWFVLSGIILVLAIISTLIIGCGPSSPTTTTAPPTTAKPTVAPTSAAPTSAAPSAKPTSPAAGGQTVSLTVANYFGTSTGLGAAGQTFIDALKAESNGRIQCTYYPGGALLGGDTMVNGVKTGIADIGWTNTGYYRNVFPVMDLSTMPMGFPSAWTDGHVLNDFYQQYKPKEWAGLHPIVFSGTGPKVIHTKTFAARTLDDLKGKKIRGTGAAGDIVAALGAVPQPTAAPEFYTSLDKGVIDGIYLPFEIDIAWKIGEVAKYDTNCWQIGAMDCFFLAMNEAKYNGLPADLKAIIDKVGNDFIEKYCQVMNEQDNLGYENLTKNGGQVIQLDDAEAAKWQAAVKPVTDKYIQTLIGLGYSQTEVQGMVKYIQDRIAYWLPKQTLKGPTGPASVRR